MNTEENAIKQHSYCVIMAGGIGSRLWPYSRKSRPKQFLDLLGNGITLLQMTYRRFLNNFDREHIFVITNERYAELVFEQLPDLPDECLLPEPLQRNTATTIAYASRHIYARDPEAVLLFAPSDHLIIKEQKFGESVRLITRKAAEMRSIITLGIKPAYVEPGYGYIQAVDPEYPGSDLVTGQFYPVKAFTEKPDRNMAKVLVESGEFFWNAGFFTARADFFVEELRKHFPELTERLYANEKVWGTEGEMEYLAEVFPYLPSLSFDYAVMEKSKGVQMLLCDFGWTDLGSWNSLDNIIKHDKYHNAYVGKAKTIFNESSDNLVFTDKEGTLVVLQGVSNILVVEQNNVLVVCRKGDEPKLKQVMPDAANIDKAFVE